MLHTNGVKLKTFKIPMILKWCDFLHAEVSAYGNSRYQKLLRSSSFRQVLRKTGAFQELSAGAPEQFLRSVCSVTLGSKRFWEAAAIYRQDLRKIGAFQELSTRAPEQFPRISSEVQLPPCRQVWWGMQQVGLRIVGRYITLLGPSNSSDGQG